jgi:hypothetical protein
VPAATAADVPADAPARGTIIGPPRRIAVGVTLMPKLPVRLAGGRYATLLTITALGDGVRLNRPVATGMMTPANDPFRVWR